MSQISEQHGGKQQKHVYLCKQERQSEETKRNVHPIERSTVSGGETVISRATSIRTIYAKYRPHKRDSSSTKEFTPTIPKFSCHVAETTNSSTTTTHDICSTGSDDKQNDSFTRTDDTLGDDKLDATSKLIKRDDSKSDNDNIIHEMSIATINIENVKTN